MLDSHNCNKIQTTATTQPLTASFPGQPRLAGTRKVIPTGLDLNEARNDAVFGCDGISWTICILSAPCSRQITTPTPHHSIFVCRILFLTPNQQCQTTAGTILAILYYTIKYKIASKANRMFL